MKNRENQLKENVKNHKKVLNDLINSGNDWEFAIPSQEERLRNAEEKLKRFYDVKKRFETEFI